MGNAWAYWKDNGAMSEADYPYTARNRADEECLTDPNATIVSTTAGWYKLEDAKTTSSGVITALKDGPLAVSVATSKICWRFYESGILSEADGCPTRRNHVVTLVGYTAAVTCVTTPKKCKKANKKEIRKNKCQKKRGGAAPWTNSKGKKKCCIEATEDCTNSEPTEGGVTTPAFWTIQNSWGSNWGNNGFMNLEVSAGNGVSGINSGMWAVTVV